MKTFKKLIYLSAFFAVVMSSCKKHDYYQVNPNNPSTGAPGLLLTNILISTFSYYPTSASYADRHLTFYGGPNVNINYNWTRSDFGAYGTMRQVKDMDDKAALSGEENYRALAKFFRAVYFAQLTETFGDVPYSEAMKALEGATLPKYDAQKDIYAGILNELDEANSMLDQSKGALDGDIIYGNKPQQILQWKKLVNAYTLRLLIHLSKKEGDGTLNIKQRFQAIVGNSSKYPLMTGTGDNAQITFNTSATNNSYPTFQSLDLQTLVSMEKGFVTILKDREDPRLFEFAEPISGKDAGVFANYDGVDAGLPATTQQTISGDASKIKERYYRSQVNEAQLFLSYSEQELLIAEAISRNWISGAGTAKEHYDNGVKASMEFYGIADGDVTDYLAKSNVAFNAANAIPLIITQKYIGFFMNSGWEAFFEQRRTGIPTLSVGSATGNGGKVPKRWMYPQDELTNNNANLQQAVQSQFGGTDDINAEMWLIK